MKRHAYVVITPARVFVFGSHKAAYTFHERAKKLPSMQGKTVEFVGTQVFQGRRAFTPPLPKYNYAGWEVLQCTAKAVTAAAKTSTP